MRPRRVFWHDELTGRGVPGAKSEAMVVEAALRVFDAFASDGSFIGVELEPDPRCVQFLLNDDGTVLVDVPITVENGSWQRTASRDEARTILATIFTEDFSVKDLSGLAFRPWKEKSDADE